MVAPNNATGRLTLAAVGISHSVPADDGTEATGPAWDPACKPVTLALTVGQTVGQTADNAVALSLSGMTPELLAGLRLLAPVLEAVAGDYDELVELRHLKRRIAAAQKTAATEPNEEAAEALFASYPTLFEPAGYFTPAVKPGVLRTWRRRGYLIGRTNGVQRVVYFVPDALQKSTKLRDQISSDRGVEYVRNLLRIGQIAERHIHRLIQNPARVKRLATPCSAAR